MDEDRNKLRSHRMYMIGISYGQFVYKYKYLFLAVWVLIFLISIPFALSLSSKLSGGGYTLSGSESAKATSVLQTTLGQSASQVFVVFSSSSVQASDTRYKNEIQKVLTDLKNEPNVTKASVGAIGTDGKTTYIQVDFNSDSQRIQQEVNDFTTLVQNDTKGGIANTYVTGSIAIFNEINQLSIDDTRKADTAALPIALVVLLVVFGTFVSASMPLMLALISIIASLAIMFGIATHQELNSVVFELASVIGLGLSIDYSLFMVRRFREELIKNSNVKDAISWTIATSGEAILFSGLTVMIGFLGMLFIGIEFMTSVGIAGAAVVFMAVISALTLLPAVLSVLGDKINAIRIPLLGKHITNKDYEGKGAWHSIAMFVMNNSIGVFVGVLIVLIMLGYPILSIKVGTPGINTLPANTKAREGLNLLDKNFPDMNSQAILLVITDKTGNPILTNQDLQKINDLSVWLKGIKGVQSVTSLTNIPSSSLSFSQLSSLYETNEYKLNPVLASYVPAISKDSSTFITVKTNYALDSNNSINLLNSIRSNDTYHLGGLEVLVGGEQASNLDFNSYLFHNFPKAIVFILLSTFFLLLLMFHSVVLPLKAVIMNTLSISVAYGVLVAVFQWGWASSLLGFTSEGYIESIIPIFMFCILFGLSMDYEVFLLSRIREEWFKTKDNTTSVAYGLEHTGGVITSAALLLIIVAGSIATSSIISTKEIGIGITVAVLVDATVIRILLVPATMKLLGPLNWWFPSFKRKIKIVLTGKQTII